MGEAANTSIRKENTGAGMPTFGARVRGAPASNEVWADFISVVISLTQLGLVAPAGFALLAKLALGEIALAL